MWMRALRPWYNADHEGRVDVGDQFQATPYRARDLERLGLAIPSIPDGAKILVTADAPTGDIEFAAKEPAKPRRRSTS